MNQVTSLEDTTTENRIHNLVNELFRELNYMGKEEIVSVEVSKAVEKQHRTLQQNFFRMLSEIIKRYGENKEWADARNQESRDWCAEVSKIKAYFPFI